MYIYILQYKLQYYTIIHYSNFNVFINVSFLFKLKIYRYITYIMLCDYFLHSWLHTLIISFNACNVSHSLSEPMLIIYISLISVITKKSSHQSHDSRSYRSSYGKCEY